MRQFIVHGEPVGKQRVKFNRYSGRAYTPEKTVNYETLVKMEYLQRYPDEQPYSSDTPVSVNIQAYFPIPSSTSNKKRLLMLAGGIRPTKKPDTDNLVKSLLDGCNGVVWEDDRCVVEITAKKWYCNGIGYVVVTVDEAMMIPFDGDE